MMSFKILLKAQYVNFGEEIQTQNLSILDLNEVMIQSHKYYFIP